MERISFGRYRHPATPAVAEIPLTAIAEKEKQRRISRAAQVLEGNELRLAGFGVGHELGQVKEA